VVAEVEQGGGTAFAVRTDLTDAASVVAAQKEIAARLGPATVLVNNAGIAGCCRTRLRRRRCAGRRRTAGAFRRRRRNTR